LMFATPAARFATLAFSCCFSNARRPSRS
jgi:hypothetical protein